MAICKTSELIDQALDWAVAKCEGVDETAAMLFHDEGYYNYSEDWFQGGPIIEREAILFHPAVNQRFMAFFRKSGTSGIVGFGETHLIAAMRCFVASKLGDTVDIPKELIV